MFIILRYVYYRNYYANYRWDYLITLHTDINIDFMTNSSITRIELIHIILI